MRLSEFLLDNMEPILREWEAFAATLLPAAADMTSLALRDHAQLILEAVAKDLDASQTRQEQKEKSKGRARTARSAPETAAQTHAVLRARSGFDINELVAEYRALRASVLRLWLDANPADESGVEEIMRFNEAIDQAVAESVGHFHAQMEQARNLFLGMLGHDMRTPLSAIITTASYLVALNAGEAVSASAKRLMRSGASMQSLLDDLVDFNRAQLGLGIKVIPADIDLAAELTAELEQLRDVYPDRRIELLATGEIRGQWDGRRLQQLLRNLVSNAIKYGSFDSPVHVAIRDEGGTVWLEVSNRGPGIDASVRNHMFDPLRRGLAQAGGEFTDDNLGLGLFIVRAIAEAHGGDVDVRSRGGETTFIVRLPRQKRDGSP